MHLGSGRWRQSSWSSGSSKTVVAAESLSGSLLTVRGQGERCSSGLTSMVVVDGMVTPRLPGPGLLGGLGYGHGPPVRTDEQLLEVSLSPVTASTQAP